MENFIHKLKILSQSGRAAGRTPAWIPGLGVDRNAWIPDTPNWHQRTSGNEIRVLCRLMSPVSRPRTKRLHLNRQLQLTYLLRLFSRICDAHSTDASKKKSLFGPRVSCDVVIKLFSHYENWLQSPALSLEARAESMKSVILQWRAHLLNKQCFTVKRVIYDYC